MSFRALPQSIFLLTAGVLVVACTTAPTADDQAPSTPPTEDQVAEDHGPYMVQFRDRVIDLEPYVQGFPYGGFRPDLEYGYMLYFKTTPEGQWLKALEWDGEPGELDITEGRVLNEIDWSTRSFWAGEHNSVLGKHVFRGDERNDEFINLYTLDVEDGTVEALTEVDYVYGFGFSEDQTLMGYIVRHGAVDPFNSCLHVRDLESGEDREIWCDEGGADRLTWSAVHFAPDDSSLLVTIQHDGDRRRTNLGRFDLGESGPPQLLLERGVLHLRLGAIRDTFDDSGVLFWSSKSGMDNLYRLDFESGEYEAITDLEQDITGLRVFETDEGSQMLLFLDLPYGTIVEIRDTHSGEVLHREQRPESLSLYDEYEGTFAFYLGSVDTLFRMERVEIDLEADEPLSHHLMATLPPELEEQLVQCDVRRVEFPTFDEVDGETRMLHGYLYEPRNPAPEALRLARMTAFYGGGNFFNTGNQIMCEAGIITFSPSPRGSRGFGAAFAALTNGDLGGDEIVDLFYGARFLEQELGLLPHQIGVYGSSHGGYATMRAMTFPPATNDRGESYPFGFGMSHAGFSDIIHFFHNSNIPDWVILEAGDPETEADKLIDRSPVTHAALLSGPLLLTHGTNDRRVPVEGSRQFAEVAEELDLPVDFVEFEGQGHGIDGLENRVRFYRATFEFLERRVDPRLGS